MAYFNFANNMCEPTAMAEMPQSRIMVHGNFFGMETVEEGPRGRSIPSLPDMFMIDAGQSWGDSQFLNVEFMGTLEKYTFPADGTPLLLQIGENKSDGTAFIDAQHPHSSPIMGLTFSDTLSLSGQDHVKFFVAPRGETTDGPIAFMHRTTGEVNPEAPLGHHIGQDVGHISSSVVGASWGRGSRTYEISFFNGTEPLPTAVDLPMGPLNSYALRLIQKVSDSAFGMVSAAVVKNPVSLIFTTTLRPSIRTSTKDLWRKTLISFGRASKFYKGLPMNYKLSHPTPIQDVM